MIDAVLTRLYLLSEVLRCNQASMTVRHLQRAV